LFSIFWESFPKKSSFNFFFKPQFTNSHKIISDFKDFFYYKILVIYLCNDYVFDHLQIYNMIIKYIHMSTF
jgi:hypothetical protein